MGCSESIPKKKHVPARLGDDTVRLTQRVTGTIKSGGRLKEIMRSEKMHAVYFPFRNRLRNIRVLRSGLRAATRAEIRV